jgi:hypothetical protein
LAGCSRLIGAGEESPHRRGHPITETTCSSAGHGDRVTCVLRCTQRQDLRA